ncbi:MAG: AAA family ATPase [Muribaculaceae bacterium]|nr:AAA family ATPase [Muribaculaceae bacterium]
MSLSPQAHIAGLRRLLRLEYEEEKASFLKIADRAGVSRLIERGRAWFPIRTGADFINSLDARIVEIFRSEPAADSEISHEFEYGKPVVFFTLSGDPAAAPRLLFTGTVNCVDGDRMLVAVPESASLSVLEAPGLRAGVMLFFDETSFRAMFDALDAVAAGKGRMGALNDFISAPSRRASELSLPPLGFPYLNSSQEAAVNKVLRAQEVAVVHGPPGTGKTTTLVEAIYETLRRESQVLVCAQSNMAVDWICEKLLDRGIRVLRIGNPSRVNDRMLAFTYERRFEAHPEYPHLWSIRKAMRELRAARRRSDSWHQKMDSLRARAQELEIRIRTEIFDSANVIASTLVGSASKILEGMTFATVFIDEAAQASEPASWIPMRRARRMILAGDHCQLPPTVKNVEAARGGLARSLMERIAANHPECLSLLSVQYRMHRDIMRFSSEWFYGSAVIAAPEVEHRGILDLDVPIEWIDTSLIDVPLQQEGEAPAEAPLDADTAFREALAGESFGRINKAEARLTIATLKEYFLRIGKDRILDERIDVGIISPYRAQVRYLRTLLRCEAWAKPFRGLISVNTVDGFQGRECDVILISLVRNNSQAQIGFLRDLRRMNVAMTRARMKLIIIGDVPTLTSAHPFYSRLATYIASL